MNTRNFLDNRQGYTSDAVVVTSFEGKRPVVWRVALFTTQPSGGTWQIMCGTEGKTPVVVQPSGTGSDLVDIPGAGLSITWLPTTPGTSSDYVAASCAAYWSPGSSGDA